MRGFDLKNRLGEIHGSWQKNGVLHCCDFGFVIFNGGLQKTSWLITRGLSALVIACNGMYGCVCVRLCDGASSLLGPPAIGALSHQLFLVGRVLLK